MISLGLVDRPTQHILHLAKKYSVKIVEQSLDTVQGSAFVADRKVLLRHALGEDLEVYATALHELGHILSPNAGRFLAQSASEPPRFFGVSETTKEWEVDAWNWAYVHAIIWTTSMDRFARKCLASYGITMWLHS